MSPTAVVSNGVEFNIAEPCQKKRTAVALENSPSESRLRSKQ
jgi:hypothetical protein